MEPLGAALEKLKSVAKSSQEFFHGVLHRRNPIEILKRLQREAFADIMKLRDRQEKVERLLSFYQTSKSGPFQEHATHVRGHVDCSGALLVLGKLREENLDAVDRSLSRTGVDSRFVFETAVRHKDTLAAEFVAAAGEGSHQLPLSLHRLSYAANVNDAFSVSVVPMGARCRDVAAIASNAFDQLGKGLTGLPSFGPPLLNRHNGSAIGITVTTSNTIASLAQFVAVSGMLSASALDTMWNRTSTFGQLLYQFPGGTKLSILGLHHLPLSLRCHKGLGPLTIPIVLSKQHEPSEPVRKEHEHRKTSVALMAESELDNFTKIGGWIEMDKLNPKSIQWAVNVFDVSEDSVGWGLSLSGMNGGSESRNRFQVESYLKFNVSNKFCLKPGLALAKDGDSKIAALMLRSNWSL